MKPHEAPTRKEARDKKYMEERKKLVRAWVGKFDAYLSAEGVDPGEETDVPLGLLCVAGDVGESERGAVEMLMAQLSNDGWEDVRHQLDRLNKFDSAGLGCDDWRETRRNLRVIVRRPYEEPVVRRGDYGV